MANVSVCFCFFFSLGVASLETGLFDHGGSITALSFSADSAVFGTFLFFAEYPLPTTLTGVSDRPL